jgi:hypothetical protein
MIKSVISKFKQGGTNKMDEVIKEVKDITGEVTLDNVVASFNKVHNVLVNNPESVEFNRPHGKGNPVTLGPAVLSGKDWAAKQIKRAVAASDDWLAGVLKPRKLPNEAAIAANAKRIDRLAESEKQGKWLKAMQNVDIDQVYEIIKKLGSGVYKTGIEARDMKIAAVYDELQPLVASMKATIDAMPQATDSDREKRLIAARRLMIEIGKKRRGIV